MASWRFCTGCCEALQQRWLRNALLKCMRRCPRFCRARLGARSAGSEAWCELTTCAVSQCAPVVAVQPQPGGFCARRHRFHGVPLSPHPCCSRSCSPPWVAEQPGRCAACCTVFVGPASVFQCMFCCSLLLLASRLCAWCLAQCQPKLQCRPIHEIVTSDVRQMHRRTALCMRWAACNLNLGPASGVVDYSTLSRRCEDSTIDKDGPPCCGMPGMPCPCGSTTGRVPRGQRPDWAGMDHPKHQWQHAAQRCCACLRFGGAARPGTGCGAA